MSTELTKLDMAEDPPHDRNRQAEGKKHCKRQTSCIANTRYISRVKNTPEHTELWSTIN